MQSKTFGDIFFSVKSTANTSILLQNYSTLLYFFFFFPRKVILFSINGQKI